MLTKRDLRWTFGFFTLYSKLMWIPVTFKPVMLGGDGAQIESEKISIWRRIGFKMAQILIACQTLFISIRTLEYVSVGDRGFFGEESVDVDVNLDWDFVPFIITQSFLTANAIANLVFVAGRELNGKVFNEFIRLRGKVQSTEKLSFS